MYEVDKSTWRRIGGKYGPDNTYGTLTILDPRLNGLFRTWSFPGILFRIHPGCDGLICHDGEVVVQSLNGPVDDSGQPTWVDFIREQQDVVLSVLADKRPCQSCLNWLTIEEMIYCQKCQVVLNSCRHK